MESFIDAGVSSVRRRDAARNSKGRLAVREYITRKSSVRVPSVQPAKGAAWTRWVLEDADDAVSLSMRSLSPNLTREFLGSLRAAEAGLLVRAEDDEEARTLQQLCQQARHFLLPAYRRYCELYGKKPALAQYEFGPEDSLDVVWRTDSKRLLINFTADDLEQGAIAGIDRSDSGNDIEGSIDLTSSNPWFLQWLEG